KNPQHWKLLVFYYNPDQPRLFVAKRTGTPVTLNFAKPMAWAIVAIPFAIMTAGAILGNSHLVR
ncbi:MAG TPA: hypothetical protein VGG18_15315, partial [Granulicella sp.]